MKTLVALAQIRKEEIDIEGEKVMVREVSAADFASYVELAKTDRPKAMAGLLVAAVLDGEGNPGLSTEEALLVAASARVSMPIINKVLNLGGFGQEDSEKHANAS